MRPWCRRAPKAHPAVCPSVTLSRASQHQLPGVCEGRSWGPDHGIRRLGLSIAKEPLGHSVSVGEGVTERVTGILELDERPRKA